MSISAMKQALEALDAYSWEQVDAARAALRQAIAEAEDAVAAEREACAKLCDGWPDYNVQGLAEAIRARGDVHASDISQEPVDKTAKSKHEPDIDIYDVWVEKNT